jgi:prepilin-type N-terminal cleavage/methylation domain-containing protein
MKINQPGRRQKGFTLLELLATIVLIAIFGAIVLGRINGGRADGRAQGEADIVVDMFNAMTGLKAGGSYGATGTDLSGALIAKQKIPSAYNATVGAVTNQYGGAVSLVSSGTTVKLTENGYPPEACVAVAQKVSTLGSATLTVNGSNLGSAVVGGSAAANACSQAGQANVVVIQSLS